MAAKKKAPATDGWMKKFVSLRMDPEEMIKPPVTITTGSLSLDMGLGLGGGFPMGTIIRLYGRQGCGKTAMCQIVSAAALAEGRKVLWIDAESRFDSNIAARNGLDVRDPNLFMFAIDKGEEDKLPYESAVVLIDGFIRENPGGVVVVDSLDALRTQQELESIRNDKVGDSTYGSQAKISASVLPTLNAALRATGGAVILIQQARVNMGDKWNPERTAGGKAVEHFASVEVHLIPGAKITNGDKGPVIGRMINFKIMKNSHGRPYVMGAFPLSYERGIHFTAEVLEHGTNAGLIQKSGAFYRYNGEVIGQGGIAACAWLDNHPDALLAIEAGIRSGGDVVSEFDPDEETQTTEEGEE